MLFSVLQVLFFHIFCYTVYRLSIPWSYSTKY
nr:MAG TPA: hypothetical protein [Caudoviricetes sp.]DAH30146.1 MAG TPA: hypothetical protein [Caudoviricetes sp.]